MKSNPTYPRDIQILGTETRYQVVRADAADGRDWLKPGRVCPWLGQHQIEHVGIMEASEPFEVVRNDQSGAFMLACLEGEGAVMADGMWKRIRVGNACLLPAFVMNSLKCLPGKSWTFAWVRYRESRDRTPIVSAVSPVAGLFDGVALRTAIHGLHAEAGGANNAAALYHWAELIHHYVLQFARPHTPDARLWRLWQAVEAGIDQPWSLGRMAAIACVSEEHLRRLCRKELGRSPMQHLTHLRLHRAVHLLSTTEDKVEVIARNVGFESVFTFSNTFKKWIGWRPSDHRRCG